MNTQGNKTNEMNNETKHNVVLHADLLKACSNELPVIVTYGNPTKLELDSEWYVSVCCSIRSTTDNRTMSAIGVASKSSLHNDLQRANPIKTAEIRAFDRAMMNYMGFDESCLSDWEVEGDNNTIPTTAQAITEDKDLNQDSTETVPNLSQNEGVPPAPETEQTSGSKPGTEGEKSNSLLDQRRLFSDDEVMLIGEGLVGYTYDVVKNFRRPHLMNFLHYLNNNPGIHYDDKDKQNQLEKLYEAASRIKG